ncbi:MAG: hypothetical protein NVSMB6_04410 [Burkholderiaceae bacterium]
MIEIVALTYDDAPLAPRVSACFGHVGGTIGRGDDNHLVLADPKHHVSRLQASVLSDGDWHQIINLSQANPTVLNGVELDCDKPCRLRVDDEIRIGTYRLRVQMINAAVYASPGPSLAEMRLDPGAFENELAAGSTGSVAVGAISPMADTVPADADALLQAFLSGAGIPSLTLSSGMTPELMYMLGGLLATAVDGTVNLLSMRSLVKREANADVTMVVVRNNNPLKFLPDGAAVLTQMLRKRMPGFLPPVEAMRDAYIDLHAHQLGLLSGLHARLNEQHSQLDPARIEAGNDTRARLDWLLPANRKARLWDRYRAIHSELATPTQAQITRDAAFLAAYERASEQHKDEAADERCV